MDYPDSNIILGRLIQVLVANGVLLSHDVRNIMRGDDAPPLTPEDIAKNEWEGTPTSLKRRSWDTLSPHIRQLLVRRVIHRDQFSNNR